MAEVRPCPSVSPEPRRLRLAGGRGGQVAGQPGAMGKIRGSQRAVGQTAAVVSGGQSTRTGEPKKKRQKAAPECQEGILRAAGQQGPGGISSVQPSTGLIQLTRPHQAPPRPREDLVRRKLPPASAHSRKSYAHRPTRAKFAHLARFFDFLARPHTHGDRGAQRTGVSSRHGPAPSAQPPAPRPDPDRSRPAVATLTAAGPRRRKPHAYPAALTSDRAPGPATPRRRTGTRPGPRPPRP